MGNQAGPRLHWAAGILRTRWPNWPEYAIYGLPPGALDEASLDQSLGAPQQGAQAQKQRRRHLSQPGVASQACRRDPGRAARRVVGVTPLCLGRVDGQDQQADRYGDRRRVAGGGRLGLRVGSQAAITPLDGTRPKLEMRSNALLNRSSRTGVSSSPFGSSTISSPRPASVRRHCTRRHAPGCESPVLRSPSGPF